MHINLFYKEKFINIYFTSNNWDPFENEAFLSVGQVEQEYKRVEFWSQKKGGKFLAQRLEFFIF